MKNTSIGSELQKNAHRRAFQWTDLQRFFRYDPDNLRLGSISSGWLDTSDVVNEVCPDVFAVPFFTSEFCKLLIAFAECVGHFSQSPERDGFSAPEIKLRELSPMIEASVVKSVVHHLTPIILSKWSVVPAIVHPPFITKYSMETQKVMGRHHDMNSDVSISINLNDEFDGGGLFFPRQNYSTRMLPVGTAVIFPGRVTHLHEGLEITEGERFVLTIWTEHRD